MYNAESLVVYKTNNTNDAYFSDVQLMITQIQPACGVDCATSQQLNFLSSGRRIQLSTWCHVNTKVFLLQHLPPKGVLKSETQFVFYKYS